jgi:hypothetical protein
MNSKLLGMLGVAIIGAPAALNAQTTTLAYQGNVMSGSSSYLPSGFTYPSEGGVVLPSSPFSGTYTASITLTGSLAANNLYITSYSLSLTGSNGYTDGSSSDSAGPASPIYVEYPGGTSFCGSLTGSCIDLTTANGAITGASIEIFSSGYHESTTVFGLESSGDWYSSQANGTNGGCNIPYAPGSVYTGPTINPCTVSAGNAAAGNWTVSHVPEMDGSSALSGMMLLIGGAAVLRGRARPSAAAVP